MKKITLVAMLLTIAICSVACGSEKKTSKTEEQAEQRTSQLQEDVESMEEDYKNYVENMGIDVDAAMKESGY